MGSILKDGSHSEKGDFAIALESLIEAGAKTGYMARVKRAVDCQERALIFSVHKHHVPYTENVFSQWSRLRINRSFWPK